MKRQRVRKIVMINQHQPRVSHSNHLPNSMVLPTQRLNQVSHLISVITYNLSIGQAEPLGLIRKVLLIQASLNYSMNLAQSPRLGSPQRKNFAANTVALVVVGMLCVLSKNSIAVDYGVKVKPAAMHFIHLLSKVFGKAFGKVFAAEAAPTLKCWSIKAESKR